MQEDDEILGRPDLDDDFQVEAGDMLYKPIRKGQAIMLNAGTVLTPTMIAKIAEAGLLDEARRCIKKAIRDPGLAASVSAHYDAEIDKAQRIRDSLSSLRLILWLLLAASGGYAALTQMANIFYVYLAGGMFVAIVITYLVSMGVYDGQTKLMKEKSDRIKAARRKLEERAERTRQEKIEAMRHRLEDR
ncbi:MAG: hypothetical protein FJZ01_12145 [Candidatus Sericytochromatia bacterium]|nr:hypothetical protein [Candidatus Tanganyikabacteria bacterium]